MEDDKKHAEKAAPNAHFEKLVGSGPNGWRQKERFLYLDAVFTDDHVFGGC